MHGVTGGREDVRVYYKRIGSLTTVSARDSQFPVNLFYYQYRCIY